MRFPKCVRSSGMDWLGMAGGDVVLGGEQNHLGDWGIGGRSQNADKALLAPGDAPIFVAAETGAVDRLALSRSPHKMTQANREVVFSLLVFLDLKWF